MRPKKSAPAKNKKADINQLVTGRVSLGRSEVNELYPDIANLLERLRFSIRDGQIWFDTQRVTLIHLSTLTALRLELINSLGKKKARGFLTRMGWESGARDANLARKLQPQKTFIDIFLTGLQMRRLQGVADTEVLNVEADIKSGHFYGDFSWTESFEADAHVSAYGVSDSPVCWLQLGYYCGYSSTLIGRTILYREVECLATGGTRCRIIGKPVSAWGHLTTEMGDMLQVLQPESFVNRFQAKNQTLPHFEKPPERTGDLANFPSNLVGVSTGFVAACYMLKKVAPTVATVLFFGETGVGKEIFAKTLHKISNRADKPFVAVNCAAIPDNLVEAELFGVVKGAYTGAVASRPGRFERANGGTLFLDEVGTLSLSAQLKLLRAIQEKEIERVGDTKVRKIDVRIITATNVDLHQAVSEGTFRQDLLYRLYVFPIRLPPLRERRDDIPLLIDYFLQRYVKMHDKPVSGLTPQAVEALYGYDYPGNVRELENLIERAVILCDGEGPIDLSHLFTSDNQLQSVMLTLNRSGTLGTSQPANGLASNRLKNVIDEVLESDTSLQEIEDRILSKAVEKSDGNLARAARLLGLTRPQLAYRLGKNKA